MIVIPRGGYEVPEVWTKMKNVSILNAVFGSGFTMIKSNLSSSEIRHRIDHMAGSVYGARFRQKFTLEECH